ncbi:MAG TPA: DUF3794 domain-containing protein [Clostridiales bacterium]|nr:DUF3794 domain-containing protein [Clostridiales bacterium]
MTNDQMTVMEPGEFAADLIFEGSQNVSVASEFILPDYLPDIERILRVTARTEGESELVSDGELHFNGEVIFSILYLAEDCQLKSVAFAADYSGELVADGIQESDVVISETDVADACAQLSNPRKLLFRCQVIYTARVYRMHMIEPQINGVRGVEDELTIERDKVEVPAMEVRRERSEELSGSIDIELDASQPPVDQIVLCELDIITISCTAESGMLSYHGEGVLRCLYQTPDGGYAVATQRFPVNAELALALRGKCGCYAKAKTGEITASVEPNSYGEPRIIEVDYTYWLDVPVFYASTVKLTRDIYSTDYECLPVFGSCVLRSPARTYETNFTVNAVKPRGEVTTDVKGSLIMPVMTEAAVKITDVKLDSGKNKLIAEGEAEIFMLALCRLAPKTTAVVEHGSDQAAEPEQAEPETTYCGVTFSYPVKCELDAHGVEEGFGWQCSVGVSNVKGRLDSTNVYADFEVNLNLVTENVGTYEYVTAATLDTAKSAAKPAASLILYYPAEGESLWYIAKKYKSTCRDIALENGITEGDKLPTVLRIPLPEKRKPIFSKVI